jgi:hypothetical protein
VQSRSFATASLRQPLLVAQRSFAAKCVIHSAESHARPRAAGVSPPWVGKCASGHGSAVRRQTADGVCPDRRCGRGHRRHGANVAPESYMGHAAPDYNRVHRRHGGLTPPALALQCECLPAKQQFLRCTNAHSTESGGRQPAVVDEMSVRTRQRCCSADNRGCMRRSPLRSRASAPRGKRSTRIGYGSCGSGLQSRA